MKKPAPQKNRGDALTRPTADVFSAESLADAARIGVGLCGDLAYCLGVDASREERRVRDAHHALIHDA